MQLTDRERGRPVRSRRRHADGSATLANAPYAERILPHPPFGETPSTCLARSEHEALSCGRRFCRRDSVWTAATCRRFCPRAQAKPPRIPPCREQKRQQAGALQTLARDTDSGVDRGKLAPIDNLLFGQSLAQPLLRQCAVLKASLRKHGHVEASDRLHTARDNFTLERVKLV